MERGGAWRGRRWAALGTWGVGEARRKGGTPRIRFGRR